MTDSFLRAIYIPSEDQGSRIRLITHGSSAYINEDLPSKAVSDHTGQLVSCYPLKANVPFSLGSAARTDMLVNSGVVDIHDTIDPAIYLTELYVRVGGSTLRFDVSTEPTTGAARAPDSHNRVNIDLTTRRLVIDKDTRDIHGRTPGWAKYLAVEDITVALSLNFKVSISLTGNEGPDSDSSATTKFTASIAEEPVALNYLTTAAVRQILKDLQVVGFHLDAYYTTQLDLKSVLRATAAC